MFSSESVPFNFYWTTLEFSHNGKQFYFMSLLGIILLSNRTFVCVFFCPFLFIFHHTSFGLVSLVLMRKVVITFI